MRTLGNEDAVRVVRVDVRAMFGDHLCMYYICTWGVIGVNFLASAGSFMLRFQGTLACVGMGTQRGLHAPLWGLPQPISYIL